MVQDCYELTKKLIDLLKNVNEENRDEVIANVEDMLEQREMILQQLNPPFSNEEQQMGEQLIKQQAELDQLLQALKSQIQKDMNGLNKKKASVHKYVNPYEALQNDGAFYDKRN